MVLKWRLFDPFLSLSWPGNPSSGPQVLKGPILPIWGEREVYVEVDDISAILTKVEELGGSVMVPENEVTGMGHFAWIKDPDGNQVGLWKPIS